MPDFSLETERGVFPVVGVDEVGYGPWAGPVVAGAVVLLPDKIPPSVLKHIHDSKKLSRKKRIEIVEVLSTLTDGVFWSIGSASVEEIDQHNIRQATLLAMKRAIQGLLLNPRAVLVDGVARPSFSCPVYTVVGGDKKSYSIAAASLFAKVNRDQLMDRLAQDYPQFSWEKNAGYGTRAHRQALEKYGITPHHRKSYAPIKSLLQKIKPSPHQDGSKRKEA